MELIEYLKQNKDIISLSGIEKATDIPNGTLRGALSGSRTLPTKHADAVKNLICTHLSTKVFVQRVIKGNDIVQDITHYELQMDDAKPIPHPIKNTYAHKKTGEIVKIDYRKGAFRFI